MNQISLKDLDIEIGDEVYLPDGGRIVRASWGTGATKNDLALANHNVFRLDAEGKVVWQVQREESPTRASWETLHDLARRRYAEGARESAYGPEGYWDPFMRLYLLNCPEGQAEVPCQKLWRPGCEVYLTTRMTDYLLDIDTGIATGTGEQVK